MAEAKRAVIYCRISKDRDGEALGVERQEADCRALAERLGWEVVGVFVDNDISASIKSKKARPRYSEMIRLARAGQVGAILSYSNSRLTRRPREFEDLIDLAEHSGVRIVTAVSGEDDLSTADGRMVARIKASVDAAEADRTSERARRAKAQAALDGKYRGGPRPYGFAKDGVTIREKEAEVIRYATKAVLNGRTLAGLVKDLNDKGHKTSRGADWSRHSIRDVLLRPRNAGFVGNGRVRVNSEKGERAVWKPIITEEEFDAVERILLDPIRRTTMNTESSYLGSGIYTCGRCHSVMRSFTVPRRNIKGEKYTKPAYRCQEHDHLTVMAEPTDDYVAQVVAEVVRDPRIVEAMTAGETDGMQPDRERRSLLMTRLEQTEADYDDDLIDARRYKAKVEKINTELVDIESRMADAVQAATINPIFAHADPGQAFLDAPLDVRRAVLRSVLRVEVQPYDGARGAAWSPERLRVAPVVAG